MECNSHTTMNEFAEAQTLELVRTVVENINRTADDANPEAVHKLRVSIRRLQQSLRLFQQYFPKQGSRRVRKQTRSIMKAAGELRNLDIAIESLEKSHPAMIRTLEERRRYARRELVHVLTGLAKPGLTAAWLSALALGDAA